MKSNIMEREEFGLLVEKGGAVPLIGVDVTGEIIGKTAKVRVKQHFYNDRPRPIEAVYKFPLPEGATVCGFTATVGDRVFAGKVEERDKAYETYDDAIKEGGGGFLLDQERPNIFTLSVGNMKPRTSAVIAVDFVTLLDSSGVETRFSLPTTISPRYVPADTPERGGIPEDHIVNPPVDAAVPYGLTMNLAIHGKDHIDSVESPSHHIKTTYGTDAININFSGDKAAMDRDFILTVTRKSEFMNACYYNSHQKGLFFQLDFALPGENEEGPQHALRCDWAREIVFLIDCSGSMDGSSITQARRALDILVKGLGHGISFNIFRFGNTFESLFEKSAPYSPESVDKAKRFLKGMRADLGGTEVLGPLKAIYSNDTPPDCLRSIILLTDGEMGNEKQVLDLVDMNSGSTRVFTVGIGYGPNEYFIKQVARSSGGSCTLVAPNERIEPKVLGLFNKVISGGIDDLHIGWGEKAEQAPSLPAVFANGSASIFGFQRNSFILPEQMVVSGKVHGLKKEWTVALHEIHGNDTQLPLLWARERIRDLEEGTEQGEPGSRNYFRKPGGTKDEIIKLSKAFGIISSETSFVAVEEREGEDKAFDDMTIIRVPVMLTKDWGGTQQASMLSASVCYDIAPLFMKVSSHASKPDMDSTLDKAEKRPAPDPRLDLLMYILSCQRPEGGFAIDRELANRLGIPHGELKKIADMIICARDAKEMQDRLHGATAELETIARMAAVPKETELPDRLHALIGELEKISHMTIARRVADGFVLLSTAIITVLLHEKMSDMRNYWENVTEKSDRWLHDRIREYSPIVEDRDLMNWVERNMRSRGVI